jgi:hypothetical protein
MTAISIPSTTRPDELLLRCESDCDELLIRRLLVVLRGEGGGSATDISPRVEELVRMWDASQTLRREAA